MRKNGFTFIELMLILVIIAILALVVISGIMRQQTKNNELVAIGNLRLIVAAELAFQAANGKYASSFDELTKAKPPFEGDWYKARRGYKFSLSGSDVTFAITANPTAPDSSSTGPRHFFVNEAGVIRFSVNGPADSASPVLTEKD